MSKANKSDVLLVGAGHAHLHVCSQAYELAARANVTLIDPGEFWYSGLATGMLGGMVEPSEDCISVSALAARSGIRHVASRVTSIATDDRYVTLGDGTRMRYDILSLNVGSEVETAGIDIDPEWVWAAKPIRNLERLRRHLERVFASRSSLHVVVIGGGPTGCEIAANIDGLARRHAASASIRIVTSASCLLDGYGRASRTITSVFARRGIEVRTDAKVIAARDGVVCLADGSEVPCDVAVLAAGLRPPALIAGLPPAYRAEDRLRVDASLRCPADPHLFGAGDCVYFEPKPLPAVGVYAVREAPVLLANLVASSVKKAILRQYEPQNRALLVMNLGDGRGLAMWGGVSWFGRSSLWLKNRIDRTFLARYREERPNRRPP